MKRRTIIVLSLCAVLVCAVLAVILVQKRAVNLSSVPNNDTAGRERTSSELENSIKTSSPLSDEEHETIRQQSSLLRELSEVPMSEETADHVAEAFVRCIRLEDAAEQPHVDSVKYERSTESSWEFWVVSSSSGVQYWMWGFTHNGSFSVIFVNKENPDGELLLGHYDD